MKPANPTQYVDVAEVMALTGAKKVKAYELIKKCNIELAEKGCLTISGRCPRAFVLKKLGLDDSLLGKNPVE